MASQFIGRAGDFDFLSNDFTVVNKKLRRRLVGSSEWDTFEARQRGFSLFNGAISVDEIDFLSQGSKGCTFRTLDLVKNRWSIYWVSSSSGLLQPPVHGGFDGDEGEFYGEDTDEGRFVHVRFRWQRPPTLAPRWEQAFSFDGKAWEVNWTMEFHPIAATTPGGARP